MRALALPAALLAAALSAGCLSTTRIEAEDNHVFIPSVRASVNLSKLDEKPSEPQPGHAIEVGYSKAKGSDSQTVGASDNPVALGPTTFAAPVQLKNEFDFSFADLSWRYRTGAQDSRILGEFRAGVAFADLDLAVSSPTQQASKRFTSRGPLVGLGIIAKLRPGTSLQARATGYFSFEDSVNRVFALEAYVVQALFDNVILRAGFASWNVQGNALLLESDFRLRYFGPALNLELTFGK